MSSHAPLKSYSPLAKSIIPGATYAHYKGPRYKVLTIARHSETLEELVIYEDSQGNLWARPVKMFLETITIEEKTLPRFTLCEVSVHDKNDLRKETR
ncbi:MAG TPA: DUF1653 domain-containing protein [Rhabdochlamydiaceae bacterium]|jgi:hypothetical protein